MREDYMRVYPGVRYNRNGQEEQDTPASKKNFLNHQKVYKFAAQFAAGKTVADIGCGSGHGSSLLQEAGAKSVSGADASTHAIEFARANYNADFSIQDITNLQYKDNQFELTVCSEVLEHVKEAAEDAIRELKRITSGILIIGTPNSELLGDHGFYYNEITALLEKNFREYCIFENALIPLHNKEKWEQRARVNRTGIIVSQNINLEETVLNTSCSLKKGIAPGVYHTMGLDVDTTLLHNTHSWMIIALGGG